VEQQTSKDATIQLLTLVQLHYRVLVECSCALVTIQYNNLVDQTQTTRQISDSVKETSDIRSTFL